MGIFENHNHIAALATAIGTLGGFQDPPDWFKKVSKYYLWNILMSTVLIYQGGGNMDFMYSFIMAVLFSILLKLTSYIKINTSNLTITNSKGESITNSKKESNTDKKISKIKSEITEEEAETFLGYYF